MSGVWGAVGSVLLSIVSFLLIVGIYNGGSISVEACLGGILNGLNGVRSTSCRRRSRS